MKTVVVDTNVLIRFLAGEERYRHAFDAYGRILVPSVVVGEFKCGTDGKTAKGRQQKKALETFLAKACVVLNPITVLSPTEIRSGNIVSGITIKAIDVCLPTFIFKIVLNNVHSTCDIAFCEKV